MERKSEARVSQIIASKARNNKARNSRLKGNLYAVRAQLARSWVYVFRVLSCIDQPSKPSPRRDRKRVYSGVATL